MPNQFSSGKFAIAECDRCYFRYKLGDLKTQILKTKPYKIKVCDTCWDPDHPQLQLGMYPVNDPQAVREPRRDNSYTQSGFSGLQLDVNNNSSVDSNGVPEGGSRVFQWGWYPVGGASSFDTLLTPNYLVAVGQVGTVTITVT
jgi:hypothetical protein